MKILIFSTAYFPHIGGAEIAVKEITDRLTVGGAVEPFSFDMITVKLNKHDKQQEKVGNIHIYRIGFGLGKIDKLLFPFRASRFANKLHKKNNYKIVWSIMASFSGFAALFFKKKNSEVKFLLTLQEGDDLTQIEKKVWLVKPWFKEIFTKADYIQCISNYLADWAKKMGAVCSVEVVPNGVNSKFIKSKVYKVQSSNEKIVLTTSRLVSKNGIEDLIWAVSLCATRYDLNVKLIICGDGKESKKLKVKSEKLGIADRVNFVGFVEPEKLEKYYAIADVFCRPSITEGLGNSFLEAMAYEIPVVATPVGGIPDFLEDEKTGYVCKVKDPESVAEKIKYILDEKNKEEVSAIVKNAKKLVDEKYNWDKITARMKNIFNKLV